MKTSASKGWDMRARPPCRKPPPPVYPGEDWNHPAIRRACGSEFWSVSGGSQARRRRPIAVERRAQSCTFTAQWITSASGRQGQPPMRPDLGPRQPRRSIAESGSSRRYGVCRGTRWSGSTRSWSVTTPSAPRPTASSWRPSSPRDPARPSDRPPAVNDQGGTKKPRTFGVAEFQHFTEVNGRFVYMLPHS